MHIRMVEFLKLDRKRKIQNSKDEDMYVDYRFSFALTAKSERCQSRCVLKDS